VATREEYLSIAEQALREGDEATAMAAMDEAEKFSSVAAQPMNTDVPSPEQDAFVAQGYANKPQEQQLTPLDYIKATPEVLATMATGATTGLLGQVAGFGQQLGREVMAGNFGTQEAADRIEQRAMDVGASATNTPESPAAQKMLGAIGEVAAPFAGLAPLAETAAIARSASMAARNPSAQIGMAKEAAQEAAGQLPEPVQAAARSISDAVQLSNGTDPVVVQKLLTKSTENELAPFRLELVDPSNKLPNGRLSPQAYKVVKDDVATKAMDQDWEAGTVQSIKNFDPRTSEIAAKMAKVAYAGTKDDTFKANNRPLSEMGDAFAQQIYEVKKAKKAAGEAIDQEANKLKNEKVSIDEPVNKFLAELENTLGVKIVPTEDRVLIRFNGSDLEGSSPEFRSAQGVIKTLVNRMYNTKSPNAHDVHRLKQFIDSQVDFGSAEGGLRGKTDFIVKSLRRDLDGILDSNFDTYRVANEQYAKTKSALDAVQELAGKKVDLEGESTPQSIGRLSRRILSNAQSAERVKEALINLDNVAQDIGAESAGSITSLVKFADSLEKQFGIAADTSLAGDLAKGTGQALRQDKAGAASTIAGAAWQKLRGVNNDKKFQSVMELLERQGGAKKGVTPLMTRPDKR